MRTTLNLDDSVLREAKKFAAIQGRTLTSVIEEALRTMLTYAEDTTRTTMDIVLPTFGGDGVRIGVDLARWDTVRNAVHEDDDATIRSELSDASA